MATFIMPELPLVDRYKLLTGLVTPRPIGWIGTVDEDGAFNLAPYSFFNAVCTDPPMVMFAAQQVAGTMKDSARNALASGEFTCNIVSHELAEAMNASSIDLPPGESEFAFAGLHPLVSDTIAAPRVGEAAASLECRVDQSLSLGSAESGTTVVFGEVVRIHVDDGLLDGTRIYPHELDAIGRLAGANYASTRDRFAIDRPSRPIA